MGRFVGGYRDALKFHPGEEITFNPQAFVQSRPESMQPFLEKILHLQIFQEVLALLFLFALCNIKYSAESV